MNAPTTFYSASAGSGKTFTLARDYLTLLFKSSYHNSYRSILAVTFTNKAVAEMKERILEYLYEFTKDSIPAGLTAVAAHIKAETGMDDRAFKTKATKIYSRLLHDYSAFDIVTIDAFNHRILRTFSRDLNLPEGFEVELDTKNLISKAVHNLIARAGTDKQLTDRLIDFSLFKINEGKSWDIEYDLMNIGELIAKENHYKHLQKLKSKSLEDFVLLEKSLHKDLSNLIESLKKQAEEITVKARNNNITTGDFKGGKTASPFKLIEKVCRGDFSVAPDAAPLKSFMSGALYTVKMSPSIKSGIENLENDLKEFAVAYVESWGQINFKKEILKNLTPLSLLNEIVLEVEKIKASEKLVPIYEFNGLLAKEIKNQPAPFIYERLGERYSHFFIDEFQDTSSMQWENMAPLVSNALQQENNEGKRGSLMLVGDAKQSIYRWRGGDMDQFLNILEQPELFMLDKKQENLEYNWRSYDEIITFNNTLFEFYSNYLDNDIYQNLYQKHLIQKTRKKEGGYVQVDFIEKDHFIKENSEDVGIYPTHVKTLIDQAIGNGFQAGEICILVRSNKQGNEVATHLVSEGISVISGDSLLIKYSFKVQTLVHLMRLLLLPDQKEPRLDFLISYSKQLDLKDPSAFIEKYLHIDMDRMLFMLSKDGELGVDVEEGDGIRHAFAKASLFQATERLAYQMYLLEEPDTRMQTFLDFVFEYSQSKETSLSKFIEHWNLKKDHLSVPAMQDEQAVQVMTVHKSKGLEFPVVIVPYADMPFQDTKKDKVWAPVNEEKYCGFQEVFLSLKQELNFYPEPLPSIFMRQSNKSQMDQINLLYVAFTRCKEQLYIICKEKPLSKTRPDPSNHSQLLKSYLDHRQIKSTAMELGTRYFIGEVNRKSSTVEISRPQVLTRYNRTGKNNSIAVSTQNGLMWATGIESQRSLGTQLHFYLSLIKTKSDLDTAITKVYQENALSLKEKELIILNLNKIVEHDQLGKYFETNCEVLNEVAFLLENGSKQIPDRLHKNGNEITIIDYKTGKQSNKHKEQINQYAQTLTAMGFTVVEKLLLYTDHLNVIRVR